MPGEPEPAITAPDGASSPAVPIDVGDGPPVLLVHGQPGMGTGWQPVVDLLCHEFRVIAPDRPGWGAHPRPATTLAGNTAAILRMLHDRGVTSEEREPLVVVGHSLGGGIALELALSAPEIVGALVLVSSVGVASAVTGIDRLLASPVVGDQLLRAGGVALQRTVLAMTRLTRNRRTEALLERANRFPAVRAVMAEGAKGMDGRDRRSFLVEQRALIDETPSIERRLATLHLPVVVIHGSADHIVSPHAATLLASAIPGAELVLRPNAGHRLPFEQPEVVAEAVRRYGALVSRGAPPRRGAPGA